MKPLFENEAYEAAKASDLLPCECYHCGSLFKTEKRYITRSYKDPKHPVKYCSKNVALLISPEHLMQFAQTAPKLLEEEIHKSKGPSIFFALHRVLQHITTLTKHMEQDAQNLKYGWNNNCPFFILIWNFISIERIPSTQNWIFTFQHYRWHLN
jgi:hypothetical protein